MPLYGEDKLLISPTLFQIIKCRVSRSFGSLSQQWAGSTWLPVCLFWMISVASASLSAEPFNVDIEEFAGNRSFYDKTKDKACDDKYCFHCFQILILFNNSMLNFRQNVIWQFHLNFNMELSDKIRSGVIERCIFLWGERSLRLMFSWKGNFWKVRRSKLDCACEGWIIFRSTAIFFKGNDFSPIIRSTDGKDLSPADWSCRRTPRFSSQELFVNVTRGQRLLMAHWMQVFLP